MNSLKTMEKSTNKKKITFILPSLVGGGAEKVFINLALYFSNKNYNVEIVTIQNKQDYNLDFEKTKIKLINYRKSKSIYGFISLYKYLRDTNSAVVYSTISHINIMVFLINIFLKKKIIYRESNNFELNLQNKNILAKLFYNIILKKIYKTSINIFPSTNLRDQILYNYKIKNKKLFVINNPISVKFKMKTDNEINKKIIKIKNNFSKIILNVGSFTKQKNQIDLIETFYKLKDFKKTCLILVGKGSLKNELIKKIIKRKIENNVFIFDFQNNLDIFYDSADLYVLTSLWEGFPNVLLDAASYNIPIISYDCNYGPSEILENGKYGALCQVSDKYKLKELIELGLKNKLKTIPKEILDLKYSLNKIGKKYEQLIYNV